MKHTPIRRSLWLLLILLTLCWSLSALAREARILVVGDSLSAAFGIDESQGWVALLQQRLDRQGLPHQVVNASISGETSAGGLSRLPALLEEHQPQVVILALGANDGLRGLSLGELRSNLLQMTTLARDAGARVLLVGMHLPPNYGPAYTRLFHQVYVELAEAETIPLTPFLLDGIGMERRWFQDDGLHPNATAQPRLLDNVWPRLESLL